MERRLMRIRSIRPEFWTSEDIASLDWHTRLIYIGLWSYVDDNGVGRDVPKLIKAALFPLEDDPHGVLMQIAGALKTLETGGQITRYKVDGKPYLHVAAWETHQKINRPTEGRYPLPTCGNAVIHDPLTESSVSPQAVAPLGEGEKGRRGEGEKSLSSDKSDAHDRFDEFWDTYGKKVKRADAEKKWAKALKKPGVTADLLIAAAASYVAWERANNDGGRFIADPSTWLHGERWNDERKTTPAAKPRSLPNSRDLELPPDGLTDEQYAAWLHAQRQRRQA
jgi:hypothetical protein